MDIDVTSNRGGTRRGAGRPKANSGLITKACVLHPDDVQIVEKHRLTFKMDSFSQSIRDIIRTHKSPK